MVQCSEECCDRGTATHTRHGFGGQLLRVQSLQFKVKDSCVIKVEESHVRYFETESHRLNNVRAFLTQSSSHTPAPVTNKPFNCAHVNELSQCKTVIRQPHLAINPAYVTTSKGRTYQTSIWKVLHLRFRMAKCFWKMNVGQARRVKVATIALPRLSTAWMTEDLDRRQLTLDSICVLKC